MFWDKKNDKGLPDLPRASSTPPSLKQYDDDFEGSEIHELPSFPDSPMQRGFSQAAIKDAISQDEMPEVKPLPTFKNEYMPETYMQTPPRMKDNKPIFVRLDKFQTARNSLDMVKSKLNEIEDLLKRIREVKTREDAELSSWENEMESIKSRIQTVMTDIFDKAEY